MEDAEFTTDFGSPFLTWDDTDDSGQPTTVVGTNNNSSNEARIDPNSSQSLSAPPPGFTQLHPFGETVDASAVKDPISGKNNPLNFMHSISQSQMLENILKGGTSKAPPASNEAQSAASTTAPPFAQFPQHIGLPTYSTQYTAAVQQHAQGPQVNNPILNGEKSVPSISTSPHPQPNGSTGMEQQQVDHTKATTHELPLFQGPEVASHTQSTMAPAVQAPQNNPMAHRVTQLHPLGIQSSATCPPHIAGTLPAMVSSIQNPSYLPLVYSPLIHTHVVGHGAQPIAVAPTPGHQPVPAPAAVAAAVAPVPASAMGTKPPAEVPQANNHNVAATTNEGRPQTQRRQSKRSSSSKSASKSRSSSPNPQVPPFYLFDAPCELRANFIQSQRLHNLPVANDSNAYHYGMAVNGFHPQLNAQVNPILPLSGGSQSVLPPGMVQLVDARGRKKPKAGKERNEREQKRAQKITELIEKLRLNMEKGGWKVEMKSKYHTLSTCADYVKHLMKTTKEKEEAVKQAKTDLEMKERKLEEDKALNEARSDPESVTSSLTASTSRSSPSDEKEQGVETEASNSSRKRKSRGLGTTDSSLDNKKRKASESGSSADSSSGEDLGSGSGPEVQNISLDKTASSVSDITDSNRGSGNAASRRMRSGENDDGLPSSSSISSTAAVARGEGSSMREEGHADIVVKVKRHKQADGGKSLRPKQEMTSMDSDFDLDYEEVFLSSNVPQLIATPAGRIVACNDFFLKATGLSREEVQRLTIFSIVQADKLANLFELVAEALRSSKEDEPQKLDSGSNSSSSGQTTSASSCTEGGRQRKWDYAAVTLPCISFPSRKAKASAHHPYPLYMTVTLMTDEDPRKRCFHCALTDCAGTNGTMGFITPELLAMLFTETIETSRPDPSTSVETNQHKSKPEETDDCGELSGEGELDDTDDQALED